MDKGISHVLSMSILLYGLRRPIFNSQDKEPYSFVELKAQEKTGLLLMPTAKVTKKRFCRRRRWKRSVFHSDFNQNKGLALLFSSLILTLL